MKLDLADSEVVASVSGSAGISRWRIEYPVARYHGSVIEAILAAARIGLEDPAISFAVTSLGAGRARLTMVYPTMKYRDTILASLGEMLAPAHRDEDQSSSE